jgi:hypothetical protein
LTDLKPTNLFLPGGDVDRVKLLDFGVARRLGAARAMTRTGVIVGTPEYMSPEQARGVKVLAPAADIFSLGCVLYECLTGEPPFIADQIVTVLVRILFEEPVPAAQRCGGLPPKVSELLATMLTKDPYQRRVSASEVAAILATIEPEPEEVGDGRRLESRIATLPIEPEQEQVLLSMVLALPTSAAALEAAAAAGAADASEHALPPALLRDLQELEVETDVLLNGALVLTVPQIGSAQDRAARAARCAVLVKEHWAAARVVVVTGRGSRRRGLLSGEALDRAWQLLDHVESPIVGTPSASSPRILVDDVSAGLLQARFAVERLTTTDTGFCLGSEHLDEDAQRRLLGKPTPCVGRERELSALEAALAECREDLLARAVLVLGPPGLGKSRLRHEFLRRLESRGENVAVLYGRGEPLKAKTPYALLGEAMRRRLGINENQPPTEQRALLWQQLGARVRSSAADALRVTVFMGELCRVPFSDDDNTQLRAARQDPRIMGDQVEHAWLDALGLLYRDQPLLLVLEDLHWSDALTIKLVEATLRRLRDTAFLVLALARPELLEQHSNLWAGAVQLLPLHPIARKAGERLVRQILGPGVAGEQVARIVEQSAGNPLFLEELIRVAGERKSGERPETVLAMIQARIGRLSVTARRALRAASVLGETFWENCVLQMLAATHGGVTIRGALDELEAEEITEKATDRRFAGEPQHRFRHTLVRDAAYDLLSSDESRSWHATAAAYLERVGERNASVLAEHYRLGMAMDKAVHWYARAAGQSYDAGDSEAALVSIGHGLACGAAGEARGALLAVEVLIRLWQGRFPDVVRLSPQALSLVQPGSKAWCQTFEGLFPALAFSQPGALPPFVEQFVHVDPRPEARAIYVQAASWLTVALGLVGDKQASLLLLRRARAVSAGGSEEDQVALGHLYSAEGCSVEVLCKLPYQNLIFSEKAVHFLELVGNHRVMLLEMAYLGKAQFDLGQRAEARALLMNNLANAEMVNDQAPLAYARTYLARCCVHSTDPADWDRAERVAAPLLGSENLTLVGLARGVYSQAAWQRGDLGTAEREAHQGYETLAAFPPYQVEIAALWSSILLAQGNGARALEVAEQMLARIDGLDMEPYGMMELCCALAEAREQAGQRAAARGAVERGQAILARHLADLPNAEMRATYLREVPITGQLRRLATTYGLDPVGAPGDAAPQ